jgi:thiamine biosynthesis protein ThiS
MQLIINGQKRDFPTLSTGASLAELVLALELKGDRVAVEQNGSIVPRSEWTNSPLAESDRLEMVHFVGGGSAASLYRRLS